MGAKILKFNDDARQAILKGVDQLAEAVQTTLFSIIPAVTYNFKFK